MDLASAVVRRLSAVHAIAAVVFAWSRNARGVWWHVVDVVVYIAMVSFL